MRYRKLLAAGVLFAGLGGANAQFSEWKLGVGAQTNAANIEDYHMGVGGTGVVAMERQMGAGDSRLGIRGNFLNYEPQDDGSNFQEYGAALEALVGPAGTYFEPKVGGHVGYVRQDGVPQGDGERDMLDVGADVMANVRITPTLDLQALVTPLWLIDEDDTDYQTRGALSLQFSIPGA